MIAPDDTELVKEVVRNVGDLLTIHFSQLDGVYLTHLIFYNRVLEQRNSLLKKYADTEGGQQSDLENLLGIYDKQILPSAMYIFEKKEAICERF